MVLTHWSPVLLFFDNFNKNFMKATNNINHNENLKYVLINLIHPNAAKFVLL
jgi:hypothetical protein